MTENLLRRLPGIDSWLATEQGTALVAEYSHAEVVEVMRAHLARLRAEIRAGGTEIPELTGDAYGARLRADLLRRRRSSLTPVINATGIVIHTNLGRAPLAEEAVDAMEAVARGYSNLEYDIEAGTRGSRNVHAESLLCELTGAEAALVVNNCAAAVVLALRALAAGGEVIVSRGELIEIGGSFRMPDVIAQSGARMVEVGTTNKTTIRDYAAAIGEESRVMLTSHPSNYRIVGFTASPTSTELARLAGERGLALVKDLGSGSLVDLTHAGVAYEPTVAAALADGADVVTFSGDKTLGGPQAGIILGRVELVEQLRKHPLARALRIDKLSLAALTATLQLYRPPNDPFASVPVLRMISAAESTLRSRAEVVAAALDGIGGVRTDVVPTVSYAGGGTLPMSELPSAAVELRGGAEAQALAADLRASDRPVIARISKGKVLLDLRTVLDGQEHSLVESVASALAR